MINEELRNDKTLSKRQWHNGYYKMVCPICKVHSTWLHLPHLEILSSQSFAENMEIAEKNGIPCLNACPDCFHEIFAGEN